MQVLPGHQLTWFLQQHGQHLKGLLLKSEPLTTLRQLAGSKINLEETKAQTIDRDIGLHANLKLKCRETLRWRQSYFSGNPRTILKTH